MSQAKLRLRQWGQKARSPQPGPLTPHWGQPESEHCGVVFRTASTISPLNTSLLFQDCASEDVEPFLESINTGAFCGHVLAPHSSVCLQLFILLGPVL